MPEAFEVVLCLGLAYFQERGSLFVFVAVHSKESLVVEMLFVLLNSKHEKIEDHFSTISGILKKEKIREHILSGRLLIKQDDYFCQQMLMKGWLL